MRARDWRIYAELAQRLIVRARRLYTKRGSGFRSRQYGLCARLDDHRSLSGRLFRGRIFRTTQGGGQDAHAAGFYAATSRASSTFSDGKLHDGPRSSTCCSRKGGRHLRHGSRLTSISPASMGCISPAPSSSPRAKSNMNAHRVYFGADRPGRRGSSAIRPSRSDGSLHQPAYPRTHLRRIPIFAMPSRGKTLVFLTNQFRFAGHDRLRPLQEADGRSSCSSSGSSSICGSSSSSGHPKNAVKTQIWIAVSVYGPRRHRQEAPQARSPRSTHCSRSSRSRFSRNCH